jgi:hypothetical protein
LRRSAECEQHSADEQQAPERGVRFHVEVRKLKIGFCAYP